MTESSQHHTTGESNRSRNIVIGVLITIVLTAVALICAYLFTPFGWWIYNRGSVASLQGETAPEAPPAPVPDLSQASKATYEKNIDRRWEPAGRGFVASVDGRIEGYDGSNGERLWWISTDGLLEPLIELSTGVGADSTVVVTVGEFTIGLDGSTGRRLWTRDLGRTRFSFVDQRALSVVVGQRQDRWVGIDPRTGKELWTRSANNDSSLHHYVTDEVFVSSPQFAKESDPRLATVVDTKNGGKLRDLSSQVVLEAVPGAVSAEITGVRGTTATVAVDRGEQRRFGGALVDLTDGRVLRTFDWTIDFIDDDWIEVGGAAIMKLDADDYTVVPALVEAREWSRTEGGWVVYAKDRADRRGPWASWSIRENGDAERVTLKCPNPESTLKGPDLFPVPGAVIEQCGGEVGDPVRQLYAFGN